MSLDRQQRLQSFVNWSNQHITGDEKGQAQIFLDRLFQAFGQHGSLDVGGHPEFRIKRGKDETGGTSFADYVWKPVVLIEMKKRGEDLSKHLKQMADYWWRLAPNRPTYAILCNFDEFWIYDFNEDPNSPADTVTLAELPAHYEPLAFLFPTNEKPRFKVNRVEATRGAAQSLANVFNHMVLRGVDRPLAQRFILQMLIALFAEDIELGMPKGFVYDLLFNEIKGPADAYDVLGNLFVAMNERAGTVGGRYKSVKYFNGGIFETPARLELDKDSIELNWLRTASKEYNWSHVSPDIFGTIFQHSMDDGSGGGIDERRAFGAHYTSPIDIYKIVRPTIVEPWTQMIEDAPNPKKLLDLLQRLTLLRVLDPACGSGNFLLIAYREMKRLETSIRLRLLQEFPDVQAPLLHVNAQQFHGMDILPFAVELAKVTMMIGRKLAIDELHISDEAPLPLANLNANFRTVDALMLSPHDPPPPGSNLEATRTVTVQTPWPPADVIIGNPPFLGAKLLKPERGPDYVNALRKLYPEVPGMADYCVYWFRRAHDHLPLCTPDRPEIGRAGLVGTQNIRNNQSRVGGLDHIVKTGTIIEAVDNQPWSGEANVHVSIANWVKTSSSSTHLTPGDSPGAALPSLAASQRDAVPPIENRKSKIDIPVDPALQKKLLIPANKKLWFKIDPKLALFHKDPAKSSVTTTGKRGKTLASKSYELDFREGPRINAALTTETDVTGAINLRCNINPPRSFNGQMLGHQGFLLTETQRAEILKKDKKSRAVIFPYLNGREVLSGNGKPDRFVLDFDQLSQLDAAGFPGAFEWVRKHVLPDRERKATQGKDEQGKMRPHHKAFLSRWWQLSFARPELFAALKPLPRFLVCSLVTKRPIFVFIQSGIRPSNLLQVFALPDDYSFGIMQSHAHWEWFKAKSSKLKSDYRFGETVWNTFPWPQSPTKKQIDAVAAAGREIRRIRSEALAKITGGLRPLYRTLELPGQNPLKSAHAALDQAVLDAYGFSQRIENQKSKIENPPDLLAQLLALNLQVAANIDQQKPVTSPGIPSTHGNPQSLITPDCIQP